MSNLVHLPSPEAVKLAASTIMTVQDAAYFLDILEDWRQRYALSDEDIHYLQATALELSGRSGTDPLAVLQSLGLRTKAKRR